MIVDTGSTDRTVEIAESHRAVLLHREWREDFAWARNEALNAATGDWILYIDADERLHVPESRRLGEGLDDAEDIIAARVLLRPRLNATPFREYRLFLNDARIRFHGAMHETMVPDLRRLKSEGGRIVDSDALIEHLGYEGDQSHKHARNLPLLRAALSAHPERLYYWHHLAETLAETGQPGEAMAVIREVLPRLQGGDLSDSEHGVAALLMGTYARLQCEYGEDPISAIELGLRLHPSHLQLLLLKARVLTERQELDVALAILQGLVAIDSDNFVDPVISYDRRILTEYAHDMMGVVLLRMGRRAEAADAFERAAKAAPDTLAYRAKAIAIRPR